MSESVVDTLELFLIIVPIVAVLAFGGLWLGRRIDKWTDDV